MVKPIRILHVIGKMDRAGAETMIMSLYRRIDRTKIQFDFMVHTKQKGDFDDEIESLGGHIFHIDKFNGFNFGSYYLAWRKFLKIHAEYHVIHGHIGSSAFIYLSAAKSLGRMTIVHSHNAFSENFNLHDHLISFLNYPNRHIATEILAASKQAGIDRYGKKVVKQNNFHVLNNAIDTNKFLYSPKKRREIRNTLGIGSDTLVIGNTGRLVEAKNQSRLINIFNAVLNKFPSAHLLVLGEGSLRKSLEQQAIKLGIESQVHLVGVKDNVADYLSAMDIFVFPSLHEGLGISLIEAQCTGIPCIASDAVPIEAKVSQLLTFISLKASDDEWVDTILENQKAYSAEHRSSQVENIKKANYDISQTLPQLSKMYLNLAGGSNGISNINNTNL
ncbi:glycosyltransferase [Lactiplantibacillus plantarum]|uniref:glycosyltransferase n=1 Tax=Lactiplantibacillus plantarum TaxID=1590 RepID=UPI000383952D|nr:glycosyltransferase [Lactiplantibacillus plantarum]AGS26703.1 Putative glycosyltransferase [Lactiplantibacillus plantarum ZJ316]